jgi:protein tyrosine phosphatase
MVMNSPQERNRYTDIIAYDKTRVKLVAGVGANTTGNPGLEYINACYVNSPILSKKIIAS